MNKLKGIPVFNRYLIVYLSMALLSVIFLNAFMVDRELHDATRTGKIIFLLRYMPYLVVLTLPVLIYQTKKQLDLLSLLVLAFYGWIWVIGKPGGLWYDEKFLYWAAGTAFFFIARACIIYGKNTGKLYPLWIPIFMLTVIGGMEAVLAQLQVVDLYPIYHGIYKVTGTFFNPAPYAGFLVGCLPYALTVANPLEKTKFTRILSWLGLFSTMVILSILPATQSRAGWLGLGAAGAVWSFYHFKIDKRLSVLWSKKRVTFLAASSVTLVLILAAGYGLYHFKKDSADGRLLIWKASSQLVKAQPFTGHGFNTFQAHYAPALADYFNSGKGTQQEEMLAGNVRWAFNEPLQYAVELGIPGLLLFLGMAGYAIAGPLKETSHDNLSFHLKSREIGSLPSLRTLLRLGKGGRKGVATRLRRALTPLLADRNNLSRMTIGSLPRPPRRIGDVFESRTEVSRTTTSGEETIHPQLQWVSTARASLMGIFVFGLFSYPFYSPAIVLLLFFALAVIAGHTRAIKLKHFGTIIQGMIVLSVSVFAVFSFIQAPKLREAYWLWEEAESLYRIKAYEAANESFEEAKPVLQTNGLFMQQYGKSLFMAEKYDEAIRVLEAGGEYYKDDFWYITMGDTYKELDVPEKAEQYYQRASQMVPHKLYPKYLLAKLYDSNGQEQKAKGLANDILTSEVKVMSTAVQEIQLEMRDILDKPMVELGNEERKASRETHNPSTPSSPQKGKEVQR